MRKPAKLVLADGRVFEGEAIGADKPTVGEVVFTTGMTGYQEVISDPSYAGQLITMTAPQANRHTAEDIEPNRPVGFIVHQLSSVVSNWRAQRTLDAYLREHGIARIAGIDTRALTRHIRDKGAQLGAIGTEDAKTLHDRALRAPPMSGLNLADTVSTKQTYQWNQGSIWPDARRRCAHIVAIDYG